MTVRMGRKLAEAAAHIAPGPTVEAWHRRIADGAVPGTYPAGARRRVRVARACPRRTRSPSTSTGSRP